MHDIALLTCAKVSEVYLVLLVKHFRYVNTCQRKTGYNLQPVNTLIGPYQPFKHQFLRDPALSCKSPSHYTNANEKNPYDHVHFSMHCMASWLHA